MMYLLDPDHIDQAAALLEGQPVDALRRWLEQCEELITYARGAGRRRIKWDAQRPAQPADKVLFVVTAAAKIIRTEIARRPA